MIGESGWPRCGFSSAGLKSWLGISIVGWKF